MKKISFEDQKKIQFEMLVEIDSFCRKNNIRYTLAYGTLIGAIRHKGFIPWDDDVDIMMPLPDMLRFKELFISDTMCYCDVDTSSKYPYSFSRISNTKTYSKDGLISRNYGVCIDLYPVLGLPDSYDKIELFFAEANSYLRKRLNMMRLRNLVVKYAPVQNIPFYSKVMKNYRDLLFQFSYENSKYFFTNGGGIALHNVHDFDMFEDMVDVEFEGHTFLAIKRYDDYLRRIYGDYMQLPPDEKRVPYHLGNYYWKEDE